MSDTVDGKNSNSEKLNEEQFQRTVKEIKRIIETLKKQDDK